MKDILSLLKESKNIPLIYMASNSPSFLYSQLREDLTVQAVGERPASELIHLFHKVAESPLKTGEDIATAYALFIAISLRNSDEARSFFTEAKEKLKFEWFSDIAKMYLNKQKLSPLYNVYEIKNITSSSVKSKIITAPSGWSE